MEDKVEIRKRFKEVFSKLKQENYIKGVDDFAKKINIHQSNLSKVFSDERNVSQSMLNNLFREFSIVNKEYIYGESREILRNDQEIGDVSNSTVVGANIHGNGITISHNDFAGMIELQKGYQEVIKKNQEQMDKLIDIIEKLKG
ncbi:MAG: helix-turn-helix transcriptional regulator [Prevotellaceae bacterium]|nr:helix-turn-helix transcriptional regulator [Prevotellaceae bacterium]